MVSGLEDPRISVASARRVSIQILEDSRHKSVVLLSLSKVVILGQMAKNIVVRLKHRINLHLVDLFGVSFKTIELGG